MFKRARWLTMGFGLGVGTTVAAAYQVRKRVLRYQPHAVATRVCDTLGTQLSSIRDQLSTAIDEGRAVARAREAELRGPPAVLAPQEHTGDASRTPKANGESVDGTISPYGGTPNG